jgi:recombinational DNA repair protein (RecF pathway)
MDEAKEPLDVYTKYVSYLLVHSSLTYCISDLNELIDALTTTETRYESGFKNYAKRFLKASEDRDQIQSCREKLKKSFEQFGVSLLILNCTPAQSLPACARGVHRASDNDHTCKGGGSTYWSTRREGGGGGCAY